VRRKSPAQYPFSRTQNGLSIERANSNFRCASLIVAEEFVAKPQAVVA
jgi:hypothetical protein